MAKQKGNCTCPRCGEQVRSLKAGGTFVRRENVAEYKDGRTTPKRKQALIEHKGGVCGCCKNRLLMICDIV